MLHKGRGCSSGALQPLPAALQPRTPCPGQSRGIRWASGGPPTPAPHLLGNRGGQWLRVRAGSTSREAHGGPGLRTPCKAPRSHRGVPTCPSAPVLKVEAQELSVTLRPYLEGVQGAAHHEGSFCVLHSICLLGPALTRTSGLLHFLLNLHAQLSNVASVQPDKLERSLKLAALGIFPPAELFL